MNVEDRALDRLPVTVRSAWLHAGRLLSSGIAALVVGERMHEQVFHEAVGVWESNTASAVLLSMIPEARREFLQFQREYTKYGSTETVQP